MLPWLAGCWPWPPLRRTVPGLHLAGTHLPSERGRHSSCLLPRRLVRPPGDPRREVSPHENQGHSQIHDFVTTSCEIVHDFFARSFRWRDLSRTVMLMWSVVVVGGRWPSFIAAEPTSGDGSA